MPLGMEVGLDAGDFVLDRDPALLPKKGRSPPIFGRRLLWPKGWMDEDATWYGSRPRPTSHCIRRGPSSPPKGRNSPPLFGPCLLWPRSPTSGTAELLFDFFALVRNISFYIICITGRNNNYYNGRSNLTKRLHRRRIWTVQSHSPGGANVYPHVIHAFVGPPESMPQTPSRSVQPFLHSLR